MKREDKKRAEAEEEKRESASRKEQSLETLAAASLMTTALMASLVQSPALGAILPAGFHEQLQAAMDKSKAPVSAAKPYHVVQSASDSEDDQTSSDRESHDSRSNRSSPDEHGRRVRRRLGQSDASGGEHEDEVCEHEAAAAPSSARRPRGNKSAVFNGQLFADDPEPLAGDADGDITGTSAFGSPRMTHDCKDRYGWHLHMQDTEKIVIYLREHIADSELVLGFKGWSIQVVSGHREVASVDLTALPACKEVALIRTEDTTARLLLPTFLENPGKRFRGETIVMSALPSRDDCPSDVKLVVRLVDAGGRYSPCSWSRDRSFMNSK